MNELLRQIPPVHELQKQAAIVAIRKKHKVTEKLWTQWIQQAAASVRQDILNGEQIQADKFTDIITRKVKQAAELWERPMLHKVINATGTVLHTNLGRARLSEKAIARVSEVAGNYSNLEYDVEKGKRGSRHTILEERLKHITGAEAAMVVNNNAGAVYLVLRALAKGKKVIVSRGELVEIGGSFRVSKVMEESDAVLTEVGTTNKTHLFDYEEAIDEHAAMIMKVHTSNFYMEGFTESQPSSSLVPLAKENHLIFYEDLGSGSIVDYQSRHIGKEPVVSDVLATGADIVSFSGDKLLGGPQAGIIAGKKKYIDVLKKHQLARVLRVDKMTLAALESTLLEYDREDLSEGNSVYRDIIKTAEEINTITEVFVRDLGSLQKLNVETQVHPSKVGGGTMPKVELPSCGIRVTSPEMAAHEIEKFLRMYHPAIIGRFVDHAYFLDFRTVGETEIEILKQAMQELDNYMS
ncbi:L-seryl-tRNA(Sec) selenium transferase [Thalassobacillus devorans]|uniref:L-seryl-tRNA(Sec) selenium transferase n=1 Tax=Thalassobacillus devorans TaxID=279813 RepID=UPI000491FDCB|nr:L-seryl-tRNA(Sec) selenium transferase [Thalassobacillus devorans]